VDIFGSQSTVNDVISGKILIDRSRAELLAELFHVDISFFF
jgi:hypothetical protein